MPARVTSPTVPAAITVISIALSALACGGGAGIGSVGRGNTVTARDRAEAADLVARGDELVVEGAAREDLMRALEGYERAEELVGRSVETMIRRARAILFIAEPQPGSDEALAWAEAGEELSRQIVERAPNRVEGHYYEALFIGLKAREKSVPKALLLLPRMASRARRAVEIDETYDDAGPLRLMGMLLITAPPWPASVGDTEEGLELLERAVFLSDYPRNRLLLAKSLIEDDETEDGCAQLQPLLQGRVNGPWASSADRWTREAKELAIVGGCTTSADSGVVEAPSTPGPG
jgi:hypothetical protein